MDIEDRHVRDRMPLLAIRWRLGSLPSASQMISAMRSIQSPSAPGSLQTSKNTLSRSFTSATILRTIASCRA